MATREIRFSRDILRQFDGAMPAIISLKALLRNFQLRGRRCALRDLLRCAERREALYFEHTLHMADGLPRRLSLQAHAIEHGTDSIEYAGTITDQTSSCGQHDSLNAALLQAEQERHQWRLTVDQIPGLIWTASANGDVDFLNVRWLQYTGLSSAESCGWGWQQALHPDDLAAMQETWQGLIASGTGGEIEARLRHYGGLYRWFLFRALPQFDSDGKVIRWHGQTTDIDALKRAEAFLASEKHVLELIVNATPQTLVFEEMCRLIELMSPDVYCAISLVDWQTRCLRYVAAPTLPPMFLELTDGVAVDCRRNPNSIAVLQRRPVIAASIEAMHDWGSAPGSYRAAALRCALRSCQVVPVFSGDGTVLGTFAMYGGRPESAGERRVLEQFARLAAVTLDRQRSDIALKESEQRFALAAAASAEGIWDWDLRSNEMFMSKRAQIVFGLTPATTLRSGSEWFSEIRFHAEDKEDQFQMFNGYLTGATEAYDGEWRVQDADGSYRWVRICGLCVRDEAGIATRLAGSVSDIDVHKRTLASLEQSNRLEALGTLAGGIAHDFNNILGVIVGYGEMASRGVDGGSRLERDLKRIVSAGERGRALADRILAFSRSGTSEYVKVQVEAVAREAVELVCATMPADLQVEVRLCSGQAAMLGDPTQIHQVVMNLMKNAFQATAAGGKIVVRLDAQAVNLPIVATTGVIEPGMYVVLRVSDTGTGIDSDIFGRIFDPFFTTKEVGTGNGLGLSLVHSIVTQIGGTIDVTSALGYGSEFRIYIPHAGETAASPPAVAQASGLAAGDGERIMIVDDEESLLMLTAEILTELGYVTYSFTSSVLALKAFQDNPAGFDMLLTDERMPLMSGTALIRAVRKLVPALPVVLMSGYLGESMKTIEHGAGADAFLKKPLRSAELAEGVARVLQGHRQPAR